MGVSSLRGPPDGRPAGVPEGRSNLVKALILSSLWLHPPGPWQADRELGELAEHAVDLDRSAVLLRDYVVADREAQPGALAGRLGREEWLEQFVAAFGRNSGSVVAHPDLDRLAEILCGDLEHRVAPRLAVLL